MITHNTIIVNGKKINFSGNAVINIKKDVSSDKEKKFDTDNKSRMIIEINGDINDIKCDNINMLINGNVKNIITKESNIKCNNINGKVVCESLNANNIKGHVNTTGNLVLDTFIGNSYTTDRVLDNFKPLTDKKILKEGLIIYHKSYGKGKINSIYGYGSMSVDFDNTEYNKTLFIDKVLNNNSISTHSNSKVNEEFEKFEKKNTIKNKKSRS